MRRYSGHSEPWGEFVDAKVNAPALLAKQIVKAKQGTIWFASVCDPYQPLEERYALTRRSLEVLVGRDHPVVIQTKSARVRRDLDVIKRIPDVEVGFCVATEDETVIRLFERESSPVGERIEVLREFKAAGVSTYAFAGPLLPGNPERLAALLDRGRRPRPHRPDELHSRRQGLLCPARPPRRPHGFILRNAIREAGQGPARPGDPRRKGLLRAQAKRSATSSAMSLTATSSRPLSLRPSRSMVRQNGQAAAASGAPEAMTSSVRR